MFKRQMCSSESEFICVPKHVRTDESACSGGGELPIEDLDLVVEVALANAESQTEVTHTNPGGLTVFHCLTSKGTSATQVSHREKTPIVMERPKLKRTRDAACGPNRRQCHFYGYESVRGRELAMKAMTSVSLSTFSFLLNIVRKDPGHQQSMKVENRLLCFLMKLKLGVPYSALAVIFNVNNSCVSRLFVKILDMLSVYIAEYIYWPSRQMVQVMLPNYFRDNFPSVRVLIDCIDIQTIKPGNINVNKLFTHYDGTHTAKYLLGITPAGFISFLSKGYDGTSSEAFIVSDSGILQHLETGDYVIADKKFADIEQAVKEKGATLLLSSFGNRSREDPVEIARIPNARIYVSRVVHRIKVFNILKTKIPATLLPQVDKIVHVCAFLANLTPPISSDKTVETSE